MPELSELPPIEVVHPDVNPDEGPFRPYARDELLARPWAIPGTPGLEHRIGGLEKKDGSGAISYDPENHQHMVDLRARKVMNAQKLIPPVEVDGPVRGDVLVLGWGGTFGACREAVQRARSQGMAVAHAHLRHLNPMPANLGEVLDNYGQILMPELNTGQLAMLVQARFGRAVQPLGKVQGRPFTVTEILERIQVLAAKGAAA